MLLEGSYFSPCQTRTRRSNYISLRPVFLWCVYKLREVDQYILMHCSSWVSIQDACKYRGPEAPMYLTYTGVSSVFLGMISSIGVPGDILSTHFPSVMKCTIFKGILFLLYSLNLNNVWRVSNIHVWLCYPTIIALTTSHTETDLPSYLWSPTGCPLAQSWGVEM